MYMQQKRSGHVLRSTQDQAHWKANIRCGWPSSHPKSSMIEYFKSRSVTVTQMSTAENGTKVRHTESLLTYQVSTSF
jgi:hypothetical protein